MALYSEHNKLPERGSFAVDTTSRTARPVVEPAPVIVEREIEAEVVLDLGLAKALLAWLEDKIHLIENPDESQRVSIIETQGTAGLGLQ